MPVTGFVAQLHLRPSFPQPQTLLCHGCRLGCAQVCELVEDKYSDVELDDLSLNPDSPGDVLRSLRRAGLPATSTRSWELTQIDHPAIPPLLEYKKLARLWTANGWHWLDSWVRGGRFRPVYVVGGVVTGRWASDGGGALQLPRQMRDAVRPDPE